MRKKICFVVAVPGTAQSFLRDHIEALSKEYDVYIAGNINDVKEIEMLNVKGWRHIDINRQISIFSDMKAVLQLRKYFSSMTFDAVHSVTPKAGLVCALAAFLVKIPIRIHIFTGQVWATKKGFLRHLLMNFDRLIARLDNYILVDGYSQRRFLLANTIVKEDKSLVLGSGSISGVNVDRFNPSEEIRNETRNTLGIQENKVVFVFMGRLNHDKGLHELLPAFNKIAAIRNDVFLLLFGSDEENVTSTFPKYENLNNSNFLYYGSTQEPHKMMQSGDIFVLPTYREGFGSSVIEAACLGLPTITSDAYGVLDASVPDETGLRCKVGDVDSLYNAMLALADNTDMRARMGQAGRKRVLELFAGDVVVKHWIDFYKKILSSK